MRFFSAAFFTEQLGSWVCVQVRNLQAPKGSHKSEKYSATSRAERSNTEKDAIPGVSIMKVSEERGISDEKVVV